MTDTSLTLDTLIPADIHACWQKCQALRWPHREADLLRFLRWSQQQGATAALRADGKLIGCGFAFFWGETHGSLGMVIVDDAWQGKGLGKRLFNQLLAAQGTRSVTLQATQAGLPLYQKMGFHAVGRARQFHGIWRPGGEDAAAGAASASTGAGTGQNPTAPYRLRALQPQDIPALLDWDSAARGITRQWLVEDLLKGLQSGERCTISTDSEGALDGYGVLRRFGRGWVLGPLLAQDDAHARALIEHLTAHHAGEFIRIDLAAHVQAFAEHGANIPAPALGEWLQAQGLAMVDEPVTMVKPGTTAESIAAAKQEVTPDHTRAISTTGPAMSDAVHINATISGIPGGMITDGSADEAMGGTADRTANRTTDGTASKTMDAARDRTADESTDTPANEAMDRIPGRTADGSTARPTDGARGDAGAGTGTSAESPIYHMPERCALIAQAIS